MAEEGPKPLALAVFVTPHGFGHASRACAVMESLAARRPSLRFEVFTQVPHWFFAESLAAPFGYHEFAVDVALAQRSALEEDLRATVRRLERFLPFDEHLVTTLAATVRAAGCAAVICDIAPLGIAVAEAAGLPSVLVENFTWSWIYRSYGAEHPALLWAAEYAARWERRATLRIQAEPACEVERSALTVAPVSRRPRLSAPQLRRDLGLEPEEKFVLLTMGGIAWDYRGLEALRALGRTRVVVPGGSRRPRREANLLLLPHHCAFFHPDLVHAAGVVIGKLGYSTVAEVCRAGVPFGYVTRPGFPESPVLERFVRDRVASRALAPETFAGDSWVAAIPQLLESRRTGPCCADGAAEAARMIDAMVAGGGAVRPRQVARSCGEDGDAVP